VKKLINFFSQWKEKKRNRHKKILFMHLLFILLSFLHKKNAFSAIFFCLGKLIFFFNLIYSQEIGHLQINFFFSLLSSLVRVSVTVYFCAFKKNRLLPFFLMLVYIMLIFYILFFMHDVMLTHLGYFSYTSVFFIFCHDNVCFATPNV